MAQDMGLKDAGHWWEARLTSGPGHSGERWLDWEHGVVSHAVWRKLFKEIDVRRGFDEVNVLMVDGGGGEFAEWIQSEFPASVYVTDEIEWPGGIERMTYGVIDGYEIVDSRSLGEVQHGRSELYDVAVFWNSLTTVANWRTSLMAVRQIVPLVLVFDQLMDPPPPWGKPAYRESIPYPELVQNMRGAGWGLVGQWAGDVMHRRLFLRTPPRVHRLTAYVSAAIDLLAQEVVDPTRARHSAWLFAKNPKP